MLEIKVGLAYCRELGINYIANCNLQIPHGNFPFSQVVRSEGAGGLDCASSESFDIPNLAGWRSFPMTGFSHRVYHIGF